MVIRIKFNSLYFDTPHNLVNILVLGLSLCITTWTHSFRTNSIWKRNFGCLLNETKGKPAETFTWSCHIFRKCEKRYAWSVSHGNVSGNVCKMMSDIVEKFQFQLSKMKRVNISAIVDVDMFYRTGVPCDVNLIMSCCLEEGYGICDFPSWILLRHVAGSWWNGL